MTDRTSSSELVDGFPRGLPVAGGPAERPRSLALEGRHVRLGPLDPARDAADLYPATHGSEKARLFAYLFDGPFESEAAMRDALALAAEGPNATVTFAIRDGASGRTVGRATYMRVEPAHRSLEVGSILFAPALARTPAATESMYLMARHAFEDLGYRRYEWKCDALNAPSRAAAERLGFRFEGVFRKHMIIKGRSRDTAWFAMTEDDWPAVKDAFEAWLAPANFDGDGRQIRRLVDLRAAATSRP
ncbi:GNAT family N-acetyltransferase [Hansschlegelia zhihuaiae]|uniref:N-acetyltransferase n=1 Tax=Hansschlegelia zhihuaiae TaxID=405005 RepID=A0A4Q0MC54_9HYPH|nr:GNAT family protein [Hansschlegelia zhihuaiae]RXF70774.1 N-acetyltransferase [Hansschlegelia zhihuaiae]